jgi:hypothetical protein
MTTVTKVVQVPTFELLREIVQTDKCPPQMKVIVDALQKLGGTASRAALVEAISVPGVLTTKQTPDRILGFYRPRMIEMGLLKQFDTPTEVETEVPDKPAKAEKAQKAEGTEAVAGEGAEREAGEVEGEPKADKVKGKKGHSKAA